VRDVRSTGNICFTCKKEIKFGAKNLFLGSDVEHSFYTWKEPCNREPPEGFRFGDKLCDKCYNSIPKQKPSKICYMCKKKLEWKMTKMTICDIAYPLAGGARNPPEGFRFLDRLCTGCHDTLPIKHNSQKPNKINTKYHTEKQKDLELFQDGLTFEISNWKINGVPQHGNYAGLVSRKPFSYHFWVGQNKKFKTLEWYELFWFGELEKSMSINFSEHTHNIDECLTFEFEHHTGKLIIETKNNIHFEFQFKFQNQAVIVDQFLKFINLRNYKISDKIIKEIKLKNNSKKIELRINKKDLHEHEEVLESYYDPMTFPFEKGKPELLIRVEAQIITNLRMMGDVWYYPAYFVNPEVREVGFGQLEEINNFTHDQYDEIFINKNPASSQGSVKFMSKGKPFWSLRNTPEPERLVELIKYAKSQFESQDKKIIEPIVSSSDNNPLKILKMRLAKGEITLEEFNEIKENLE
jgi:hypothetical protein